MSPRVIAHSFIVEKKKWSRGMSLIYGQALFTLSRSHSNTSNQITVLLQAFDFIFLFQVYL